MSDRYVPAWVTALLVLLGVIFLVIGIVYFVEPAKSLPGFFPGHLAGSAHHHTKHGFASIVVALVLFAVAWISTGTRTGTTAQQA